MVNEGCHESRTVSASATDEQLMLGWRRGDRSALDDIVRRHEDRLATIAFRITGCRHEAEDVRHNMFVQFLQSLAEVRQVAAWLTRCTVNEAIARMRRRGRERRVLSDIAQATSGTIG